MKKFTIAIAQLNPTVGDLSGNARQLQVAAEAAARQKADLLVAPELSICGYPPRDLLLYDSFVAEAEKLHARPGAIAPREPRRSRRHRHLQSPSGARRRQTPAQ